MLSWLCAFFGAAESVTAHAEILMPDKTPGLALAPAPDFSVAVVRFASGVVARMTNGLYAEHDHRLAIWGDEGALIVEDPRSDTSPVILRRYRTLRRRRWLDRGRRVPLVGGRETIARYRGSQTRDFCRAIAEMAAAIESGRPAYLGADLALHVTELTLASHFGSHATGAPDGWGTQPYRMTTSLAPMEPRA